MRVWTFLFSLYFCVGFERSGGVLHMIESVRAHAEIGSNGVWRRWTARLVRLLLLDRFGRFSCREDRVQARGQSREPNQIHEEKEPIRARADDQYKLVYCRASNQVSHKHVQNTTATYSTTSHRSSNPNQEKEGRIWHSGFPSNIVTARISRGSEWSPCLRTTVKHRDQWTSSVGFPSQPNLLRVRRNCITRALLKSPRALLRRIKEKGTHDTGYSQADTHPSTNPARPGLTSADDG